MTDISPFQNESETLQIGEMTVENRIDQLELYGSLAITRDKAGLQMALQLKAVIDAAVACLQNDNDLPEQVVARETDIVRNPFNR